MGKIVWIIIGVILLTLAAAGAYWFVKETILNPDNAIPGLVPPPGSPAAVFCGTLGGTIETHRSLGGGKSVCTLPDGKVCEAETLYQRNECVTP